MYGKIFSAPSAPRISLEKDQKLREGVGQKIDFLNKNRFLFQKNMFYLIPNKSACQHWADP